MVTLLESGRVTFIVAIVMGIVATVAVALRIIAKGRVRLKSTIADIFIIAGLGLYYAYIAVLLCGTVQSKGTLDIAQFTSPDQINTLLKYIFTAELIMTLTLTSIKLSILLWYWSIFAVGTGLRASIITVGCLCVAWCITFLFLLIFQCHPVQGAFDVIVFLSDSCIPVGRIIVAYESTNMVLDVAILSLPIHTVLGMRLSVQKKLLVACIFSLGGFVTITCGIRLNYLNFQTLDIYHGMLWSTIEIGVAIVCACLPTLRSLLQKKDGSSPSSFASKWHGSSGYYSRSGSSAVGSSRANDRSKSINTSARDNSQDGSLADLAPYEPGLVTTGPTSGVAEKGMAGQTEEGGEMRSFDASYSPHAI